MDPGKGQMTSYFMQMYHGIHVIQRCGVLMLTTPMHETARFTFQPKGALLVHDVFLSTSYSSRQEFKSNLILEGNKYTG